MAVFIKVGPCIGNINFTSLDMLGLREIDTSHPWDRLTISQDTLEIAPNFINYNRRNAEVIQELNLIFPSNNTFSTHQQCAFNIILQHLQAREPKEPLNMIIQGIAGHRKIIPYTLHDQRSTIFSRNTWP
jgi:hypothetical protein